MNLSYAEIFGLRGGQYHQAMARFPAARACEFQSLFQLAALQGGESVLDIPSGGGYLQGFFPQARVTSLELAAGFSTAVPVVSPLGDWPVRDVDRAVCLAALHHIADQPGFLRNVRRHLRPGGWLHLADVAAGSAIARFLDGFVGRWNGQGHEGIYLDPDRPVWTGLGKVIRAAPVICPWRFADTNEMAEFCAGLFDLRRCPPELLLEELRREIGIRETPEGAELLWSLLYVDIRSDRTS